MNRATLAMGTALAALPFWAPRLALAQSASTMPQQTPGDPAAPNAGCAQPQHQPPPPGAAGAKPAPCVEEVMVTATRRSENVLKIPYNITAISGTTLARNGITDLADLRNSVPGLTAADYGNRAANVNNAFIIRGISTNDIGVGESEFPNLAGATVSNYIDETPLFTNLKLTDIQRVEVLRGPQGTLFGADSVGGTVRTLHNKPDPSGFDYSLDGTISGTDHASQPNSGADLMLNIPITDRFAIRLNGGYDREAGFINADNAVQYNKNGTFLPLDAQPKLANPSDPLNSPFVTGTDHGINSSNTWFARGSALLKVNDDITAELSFQHQNDTANGFNFEAPGADYVTHRRIPLNPSVTKTDLAALTLTADFGFGTITSSTSYYNVDTRDLYDNSGIDVQFPYYYGSYPRITTTNFDFNKDRAFTQEVRLVSPIGEHFDYVAGVYFQNRRTQADSVETVPGFAKWAALPGSDPSGEFDTWADRLVDYYGGTRPGTLNPADLTYDFKRDVQFTDLAGFGEATYHITPQWRVTGGVRVFREDFRQTTIQHLFNAGTTFGADSLGTSEGTGNKLTVDKIFKANTSYDINPHTLAYFTFSQGFRAGGANAYPVGTCAFCNDGTLQNFGPDSANNYELGIKGKLGRLRYTADLYDIQWSRIQVEVSSTAGTPIIVNGNNARSRGVELEGSYAATDNLSLSGGYSYTEAELTQSFAVDNNFFGDKGALLPGVSHHQLNFSVDYMPQIFPDHDIDLHLDGSYRSGFSNQIETELPNFRHISGYALFNAFVQTELMPKITLQLFAHNLFNAKGISAASSFAPGGPTPADDALANSFEASEFVTQPLTVGLRLVIRH
jgi:iron complex outermembrane recepter protein